jgi:hypothetical protein
MAVDKTRDDQTALAIKDGLSREGRWFPGVDPLDASIFD